MMARGGKRFGTRMSHNVPEITLDKPCVTCVACGTARWLLVYRSGTRSALRVSYRQPQIASADRDVTSVSEYPREAWKRLAEALVRRRAQLGYGYRMRPEFAEQTHLSARTISRLENATRDSYPAATLAQADLAYRWEPGSVERILAGGDPIPLTGTPGAAPPHEARKFDDGRLQAIWELRSVLGPGREGEEIALALVDTALAMRLRKERDQENGPAA